MSEPVSRPVSAVQNPAATVRLVEIGNAPLSVDRVLAAVTGRQVGGVGLFVGLVRDHDGGRAVERLGYTAHPQASAMLADCAARVAARHQVYAVAVVHRTGPLQIGDAAVVVGVGAAHRGPALDACRELIDDLKTSVPIWKEQHFSDGDVEWVGLP